MISGTLAIVSVCLIVALGRAEVPPPTAETPTVMQVALVSEPSATPTVSMETPVPTPTVIPPPVDPPAPASGAGVPPGYWALEEKPVAWEINCENEWAWDGFLVPELGGYCNPGVLSQETLARGLVADHYGVLSSYAQGVMERIEDGRGVARGHGVAVMSCQLIGRTVWLRVPGIHSAFQGPFTVVDCGAPAHMFFHIAGMGLAAEVGWTTAQRWGIAAAPRIDVSIGGSKPNVATWRGVDLAQWWVRWSLQWEDAYGIYGGPRGTMTPTPP